jgi:RAP1-interacting factor 1
VLLDSNFNKRFEVYATLNNVCKTNSSEVLVKCLCNVNNTNNVSVLTQLIKNDVVTIETKLFNPEEVKENIVPSTKSDPFRIRIVAQALKLLHFFMMDDSLNTFLPIEEIRWVYDHSSTMLVKSNISKALVSPYLLLIRDSKFTTKRKKLIFDNSDLIEKMLSGLINMKPILSSSIMTEKFVCFRNFVNNFTGIMGKTFHHWIGVLIFQIFTVPPSFGKCVTAGVNSLLEVAKVFLDNKNVLVSTKQFLNSPVPLDMITNYQVQDSSSQINELDKNDTCIDYLITRIQDLVNTGQCKAGIDIWLVFTLLLGNQECNFEKWNQLNKWLEIPKTCLKSTDTLVRLTSICSWRAIIYNMCQNDLNKVWKVVDSITKNPNITDKSTEINNVLKPKLELVTLPFDIVDSKNLTDQELEAINNLFSMILYTLTNLKTKYLHVYWDNLIQPIFIKFYFSNTSHPYLHQLGLKVLGRLLQNSNPINEKNFNSLRTLVNDDLTLNEINSLPPRWVHSKFERITQTLVVIFQLHNLQVPQKISILNSFLNNIKLVTKKELKPSDATSDLIDNLPFLFTAFLKNNQLTYEMVHKLCINLRDVFDADSLVVDEGTTRKDGTMRTVYGSIFSKSIKDMTPAQQTELFELILSSITEKNAVSFLADLYNLRSESLSVKDVVLSIITSRKIVVGRVELRLYGTMCQTLTDGFEVFVKKLLQSIIDSGELKRSLEILQINLWSRETFDFYLLLVRKSPNKIIREFTNNLITQKLSEGSHVVELIKFFIKFEFDLEIHDLREVILQKASTLEGFQKFDFMKTWDLYLKEQANSSSDNTRLNELLLSTKDILNGEASQVACELLISTSRIEKSPEKSPESEEKIEPSVSVETNANGTTQTFFNQEDDNREEKHEKISSVKNETNQKRKSKSPATKTKSKKKTPVKKEKITEDTSTPSSQFDIHSFTALLNAKLSTPLPLGSISLSSPPAPKRASRKRKTTSKNKDQQNNQDKEPKEEKCQPQVVPEEQQFDSSGSSFVEDTSNGMIGWNEQKDDVELDGTMHPDLDNSRKRKQEQKTSNYNSNKRSCKTRPAEKFYDVTDEVGTILDNSFASVDIEPINVDVGIEQCGNKESITSSYRLDVKSQQDNMEQVIDPRINVTEMISSIPTDEESSQQVEVREAEPQADFRGVNDASGVDCDHLVVDSQIISESIDCSTLSSMEIDKPSPETKSSEEAESGEKKNVSPETTYTAKTTDQSFDEKSRVENSGSPLADTRANDTTSIWTGDDLVEIMQTATDEKLQQLTSQQRYEMESQMMKFILRMRTVHNAT